MIAILVRGNRLKMAETIWIVEKERALLERMMKGSGRYKWGKPTKTSSDVFSVVRLAQHVKSYK